MKTINKKIIERIYEEARHIIETENTIRETAKIFNISKSTVHKDMHDRLKDMNLIEHAKIDKIMQKHIRIRHIKGGESTKSKFLALQSHRENDFA